MCSYLTEYGARVTQHLPINDSNYEPALQLLCDKFLDKSYLIDETLKQIFNASPKFDSSLQETRVHLNEIRCLLHQLQNFDLDFFPEDTPSCVLISHIVFLKLHLSLKRKLAHKCASNYPSINDIFKQYNELNKTIFRTSSFSIITVVISLINLTSLTLKGSVSSSLP